MGMPPPLPASGPWYSRSRGWGYSGAASSAPGCCKKGLGVGEDLTQFKSSGMGGGKGVTGLDWGPTRGSTGEQRRQAKTPGASLTSGHLWDGWGGGGDAPGGHHTHGWKCPLQAVSQVWTQGGVSAMPKASQ